MSCNILIVEDQPLIAMTVEETVEQLGHHALGVAASMYQALALADGADVALVDVNLDDGPTGPLIGERLAAQNISVLFMTSDPGALRGGVPGALGVIRKPIPNLELIEAIRFVVDRHAGGHDVEPPKNLVPF